MGDRPGGDGGWPRPAMVQRLRGAAGAFLDCAFYVGCNNGTKRTLAIVALFAVLAHPAGAQDYFKGLRAYECSDFTAAKKEFRPLADQGFANAQNMLGEIFERDADHFEAVKWYRRAADQGNASAQSDLGDMYRRGHGVSRDYVQAHMWYDLAEALGCKDTAKAAAKARDSVEKKMTPAEISKARRLARAWLAKHRKK